MGCEAARGIPECDTQKRHGDSGEASLQRAVVKVSYPSSATGSRRRTHCSWRRGGLLEGTGWRRSPKHWRAGGTPRRKDPRDDGPTDANVLERRAPRGPGGPSGRGPHGRTKREHSPGADGTAGTRGIVTPYAGLSHSEGSSRRYGGTLERRPRSRPGPRGNPTGRSERDGTNERHRVPDRASLVAQDRARRGDGDPRGALFPWRSYSRCPGRFSGCTRDPAAGAGTSRGIPPLWRYRLVAARGRSGPKPAMGSGARAVRGRGANRGDARRPCGPRGPFSKPAMALRRLHGEPVSRVPGRCRCGAPADAGRASCTPCRARSRSRSQRVRFERRDAINAWRRDHRRWLRHHAEVDRLAPLAGYKTP